MSWTTIGHWVGTAVLTGAWVVGAYMMWPHWFSIVCVAMAVVMVLLEILHARQPKK